MIRLPWFIFLIPLPMSETSKPLGETPFTKKFSENPNDYAKTLQRIAQDPESGIDEQQVEDMLSPIVTLCDQWNEQEKEKSYRESEVQTQRVSTKFQALQQSFSGNEDQLRKELKRLASELDLEVYPKVRDTIPGRNKLSPKDIKFLNDTYAVKCSPHNIYVLKKQGNSWIGEAI